MSSMENILEFQKQLILRNSNELYKDRHHTDSDVFKALSEAREHITLLMEGICDGKR